MNNADDKGQYHNGKLQASCQSTKVHPLSKNKARKIILGCNFRHEKQIGLNRETDVFKEFPFLCY